MQPDAPIEITLYDPATGEFGTRLMVQVQDIDANVPDGQMVMLGSWDSALWRVENHAPVARPREKVKPVLTAADVNAIANFRILTRYPLFKQMNIMREGGDALAEMTAFIDHIRARSNALTARKSIPSTFRDDRYWD